MRRAFGSFLMLSLLVVSAFSQTPRIPFSGGFSGGPEGIKGDANFMAPRPIQLMVNAPYSGEDKSEIVQTLVDGTHITHTMPNRGQKVWRDSQGRTRIEQTMGGGKSYPTMVQIEDPVAGYVVIMDDINKVAHRVKTSVVQQRNMDPMQIRPAVLNGTLMGTIAAGGGFGGNVPHATLDAPGAANPRPTPQVSGPEDLGTQTINGVTAHGSRITSVIPTGAQGNDAPITTTRDAWYSSELNLIIRTISNDPRSGTQTMEVGNLSRSDPDPGLFMIPPGYATVDENGAFTIKWDTTSAGK